MAQHVFASQFSLRPFNESDGNDLVNIRNSGRDLTVQLTISLAIGLLSFFVFCWIRPRWPTMYYARKEHIRNSWFPGGRGIRVVRRHSGSSLACRVRWTEPVSAGVRRAEHNYQSAKSIPDLPRTTFGWIPIVYRISDKQIIASAGLDAYAFLCFFKMAIKFLFVTAILAAVILTPIQVHFDKDGNITPWILSVSEALEKEPGKVKKNQTYLWTNVVFVYLFTIIAFYFLRQQTHELIEHRQRYLGNQNSITDRTIRLSGIPLDLRDEKKLKENLESLQIGKVVSITICRRWDELDRLVRERQSVLEKLEEAHTVRMSSFKTQLNGLVSEPSSRDEESAPLLNSGLNRHAQAPILKIRRGFFRLVKQIVNPVDYYTEMLEDLDGRINEARKKEYEPTPLAFVTMDSVQAAQVMMQALLDPKPDQLIARAAPQPRDIIWANTFLSRQSRVLRSWIINASITFLSIIWLIPVATLAGLLNLTEIRRVWPGLADLLEDHETVSSLVSSFLPTVVLTLLNMAVPYLYDSLSYYQGMMSVADVELSVISKNFFFTFFNLFLAFTLFGTAFNFHALWEALRDSLTNAGTIPYLLAKSLKDLAPFYINLIVLQGIGISWLRLLNPGNVFFYCIHRYGAKTPRDYDNLLQPPEFRYSFYLPQPILVFIICVVYSVLPRGSIILFFGLVYFVFGYFTFKYQLLYAMDHPRHSTGKSWTMVVHRVIIGLLVFQLAMAGFLALRQAFTRAAVISPLILATFWSIFYYNQHYRPANYYIALKSVREAHSDAAHDLGLTQTVDEEREKKVKFVPPFLTAPLEGPMLHPKVWHANGAPNDD